MRRGFILPLIVLVILVAAGYYMFIKYSRTPNAKTTATAESIYKYPNSTDWKIKPHQNVCLNRQATCIQPVDVIFTTNDQWSVIYNYYKSYLIDYGWGTNSTVFTSIPTGIVFKKDTCRVDLQPEKPFNFLNDKAPSPPFKYVFSVTCE